MLKDSPDGVILQGSLEEAVKVVKPETIEAYKRGDWVLRKAFDKILEQEYPKKATPAHSEEPVGDNYWQDENVKNTTVLEKAQSLFDIFAILQSSCSDIFEASATAGVLTKLGLAPNRDTASEKANQLLRAGFMVGEQNVFEDGIDAYRFATTSELVAAASKLEGDSEPLQMYKIAVELALKSSIIEERTLDEASTRRTSKMISMRR
eukprot:scaffold5547_cov163-Amphora_coffeaeformis.AAC.12